MNQDQAPGKQPAEESVQTAAKKPYVKPAYEPYWCCTSVPSVQAYTSSRCCPAKRTSPLPARNSRICSMLVASESSMLMINPQHPGPAVQAHLV
jgi:hypothetical protein